MTKKILLSICVLLIGISSVFAQVAPIYNPKADASKDIENAVKQAKNTGKNVFIQIGGNWCPWCRKFHHFIDEDPAISAFVKANFIPVLVNYSKENKNEAVLAKLGFPQRFGFPVFIILNSEGKEVHIQNSGYLEQDKGYSQKKVLEFFKQWSPKALDPKTYE